MRKKIRIFIFLLFVIGLTACSYAFRTNQFPYLKNIRIVPIENNTTEADLELDLYEFMNSEFSEDGRLLSVNTDPDVLLEIKINSYKKEIYDSNKSDTVLEYKVTMKFSVVMKDMVNDEEIYVAKNQVINARYAVNGAESSTEYYSQEEAETGIYQDLFDKIIQNSLEDW